MELATALGVWGCIVQRGLSAFWFPRKPAFWFPRKPAFGFRVNPRFGFRVNPCKPAFWFPRKPQLVNMCVVSWQ